MQPIGLQQALSDLEQALTALVGVYNTQIEADLRQLEALLQIHKAQSQPSQEEDNGNAK